MSEATHKRLGVSWRRVFDWRLVVALSVLIMVVFLVWGGIHSVRRADRLVTIISEQRADQSTARANADTQRDRLLRQQARLLRKVDRLEDVLKRAGITVPGVDTPSTRGSAETSRERPSVDKAAPGSGTGVETPPNGTSTPPGGDPTPAPSDPQPTPSGPIRDLIDGLLGGQAP